MSGHGGSRKDSGRKKAIEQPPPKGQPRLSFAPPKKAVTETLTKEAARESREKAELAREQQQSAHEKRMAKTTLVASENMASIKEEEALAFEALQRLAKEVEATSPTSGDGGGGEDSSDDEDTDDKYDNDEDYTQKSFQMGCDKGVSTDHSFRFAKTIMNAIGSGKLFTASYTIVSLKGMINSNCLAFVDPPPLATTSATDETVGEAGQVTTDNATRLDEDPTHLDDAERSIPQVSEEPAS
jgi:hypothetical protein